MNTKPWKITHKKPVSEQEFLKHLWRVCPNEYARSLVLAYYKKLKRFDHQHGKQISINAYDFVPFLGPYGDHLPDQAKHLFGAKTTQKILAGLTETIGDKVCEKLDNNHHLQHLIPKIVKARNEYLEHFFNSNKNYRIGKTELFRWQFVNFVNEINTSDEKKFKGAGSINFVKKQIYLHNITPLQNLKGTEEILLKYYNDKSTLYHELTHLMALKTFNNGFYNYLIDHEFHDPKGVMTALPQFLYKSNNRKKALGVYGYGLTLLSELYTELFTSVCISNITSAKNNFFFEDFENSPTLQTVHLQTINNKTYVVHSEYQYFGHLMQLIMILSQFDNLDIVCPSDVPTQNLQKLVETFFEHGTLSPQIANLVDSKIAKKFGVDIEEVQQANNFDKFVLLLGTAYQNFDASLADLGYQQKNKSFNSAYDKNAMLLQTMILDIHKNKFISTLKQTNGKPEKVKKVLKNYTYLAGFADDWVIKPNTKIRRGSKKEFLRETASTINLADLSPDNPALKTWGDFLTVLISYTQKFAPEIFEKNKFLKNERNYINNKNNLEKY